MNILITGAFGFVGTNLSIALNTPINNYLIAVDIHKSEIYNYNEFHSWNELENVDLGKVDIIIHLAGKAHDTKNQSEVLSYFEINTGLTKKIYDWFLLSKAKKFIFLVR